MILLSMLSLGEPEIFKYSSCNLLRSY